jgi:4-hydroxy-tetrahydrodipicolinate synthase
MVDQIESCGTGNLKEARRIAGLLYNLHRFVHEDKVHHHLRCKIAAWLRRLIPSPYMRPPMPRPEQEEVYTMREVLKGAGFSVITTKRSAPL